MIISISDMFAKQKTGSEEDVRHIIEVIRHVHLIYLEAK